MISALHQSLIFFIFLINVKYSFDLDKEPVGNHWFSFWRVRSGYQSLRQYDADERLIFLLFICTRYYGAEGGITGANCSWEEGMK